jgi:acetyl-CoA acetyltransferase
VTTTNEAYILAGARTAIGTPFKGTLGQTPIYDLAETVVEQAVQWVCAMRMSQGA